MEARLSRGSARVRGPTLGSVLEIFYTGLLVAVGVFITWFAAFVVYKLFKGQA